MFYVNIFVDNPELANCGGYAELDVRGLDLIFRLDIELSPFNSDDKDYTLTDSYRVFTAKDEEELELAAKAASAALELDQEVAVDGSATFVAHFDGSIYDDIVNDDLDLFNTLKDDYFQYFEELDDSKLTKALLKYLAEKLSSLVDGIEDLKRKDLLRNRSEAERLLETFKDLPAILNTSLKKILRTAYILNLEDELDEIMSTIREIIESSSSRAKMKKRISEFSKEKKAEFQEKGYFKKYENTKDRRRKTKKKLLEAIESSDTKRINRYLDKLSKENDNEFILEAFEKAVQKYDTEIIDLFENYLSSQSQSEVLAKYLPKDDVGLCSEFLKRMNSEIIEDIIDNLFNYDLEDFKKIISSQSSSILQSIFNVSLKFEAYDYAEEAAKSYFRSSDEESLDYSGISEDRALELLPAFLDRVLKKAATLEDQLSQQHTVRPKKSARRR